MAAESGYRGLGIAGVERLGAFAGGLLTGRGGHWLRWLLAVLLVILLAQGGARLTWWLLGYGPAQEVPAAAWSGPEEPAAPGGDEADAGETRLAAVARLHLLGQAEDDDELDAVLATEELPETRLNLELKGVLARGGQGQGAALIASRGRTEVFRVSDEVPGGATLVQVHTDRVVLRRDGRHELLRLPRKVAELLASADFDVPGTQAGRGSDAARVLPAAARGDVDREALSDLRGELTRNPERLWDIVNVRPVMEGGRLQGYRLQPVQHQALFRQAGLRDDDVVTAVNGVGLDNPARMGELMGSLATADRITLDVRRDGRMETVIVELQ
ncbi:type II secretion system protein GspC [Alkalilimnicola ehrlichii MLHE-1]|uniref:General secretion pathway protein C n=1 Tax=Alkalilimnicola ehrlichii (strain ATCC BAA-1101 / DSM 17681 / MLHE-1) TaxID=187272 RepID=Q0A5Z5_ALKEH|nr:type II secretion system protein GspC [Alkalilimnicola ehrlichii]ABI57742.1 general secretion pathway protein C [Alkalilimnicola ehrlichii MLHE-1]